MDGYPPIADLVLEALDHDGPIGRGLARGLRLAADVVQQRQGGLLVQATFVLQPGAGFRFRPPEVSGDVAYQLRYAVVDAATEAVAAPEGDLVGLARRRPDQHPVALDGLHTPDAGAQREGRPPADVQLGRELLV